MADPIPVIACGKRPEIAQNFVDMLQPEYEVIHIILTPEQGAAELPALLRGEQLPSQFHNKTSYPLVGTQRFDRPPVAIVLGGGYNDEMLRELRDSAAGAGNVPWLYHAVKEGLPIPTKGPPGPEYIKAVTERLKAKMRELEREGKMQQDGVYGY